MKPRGKSAARGAARDTVRDAAAQPKPSITQGELFAAILPKAIEALERLSAPPPSIIGALPYEEPSGLQQFSVVCLVGDGKERAGLPNADLIIQAVEVVASPPAVPLDALVDFVVAGKSLASFALASLNDRLWFKAGILVSAHDVFELRLTPALPPGDLPAIGLAIYGLKSVPLPGS